MKIVRNKFGSIVIDLEGEKEVTSILIECSGVIVVGEAICPTKRALDLPLCTCSTRAAANMLIIDKQCPVHSANQ